jgi:uncharacterized protein YbaP (TraB family)
LKKEETMKSFARVGMLGLAASMSCRGFAQTAAKAPAGGAGEQATVTAPAILTEATPALWKLKGVHGTVYLFGSVHVMKKDVHWETAKVKDALGSSGTLYLEIAEVDDASMAAAQPAILQLGVDAEHPLSTKISKEDVDLLDAALKTLGMPGEQTFEPMQPWLVYLTLSVLPAMQAGYDPNSGIDKLLAAEETAAGKPVKGFETLMAQIHMVADMPQAMQVKILHQTLVDLPKSVSEVNSMVADWTRGDVEAIGKMDNDEMKEKYPDLYQLLLVKRNEAFADALTKILNDPATGTVFAAVGAAHLAGSDSVLKMLRARGIAAERVE